MNLEELDWIFERAAIAMSNLCTKDRKTSLNFWINIISWLFYSQGGGSW